MTPGPKPRSRYRPDDERKRKPPRGGIRNGLIVVEWRRSKDNPLHAMRTPTGGDVISGAVTVTLTDDPDDWNADRRRLSILEHCPNGARVVVQIGRRTFISPDAVQWLHRHDHRLDIEIQGSDPASVLAFITAGRTGDWRAT